MTVTEIIAALEAFRAEHGDLEVYRDAYRGRVLHRGPELAFVKILKGRERTEEFWHKGAFGVDQRGPAVCRM